MPEGPAGAISVFWAIGVEAGAVGRQEAQLGPGCLDGVPNRRELVGRQVVHHDDVAGSEPAPGSTRPGGSGRAA